jgi:hypothetical protein
VSTVRPERTDRLLPLALPALLLFLALRVAAAILRPPFFDELFTSWISRLPLPAMMAALRNDSGPPLYYLVVHGLSRLFSAGSFEAGRAVSLLAALAAGAILFAAPLSRRARVTAFFLLASLPVHVYYSAEARAYSLAALCLGIALVALMRWNDSGRALALLIAVAALAAGAYAHYDAVLEFPLPLLAALTTSQSAKGGKRRWMTGAAACGLLGLLFIPGFLLLRSQPVEAATRWMARSAPLPQPFALSYGGPFPSFLIEGVPWVFAVILGGVWLILMGAGLRSPQGRLAAAATLLPFAAVLVLSLFGRSPYYPFRFESILAVPMVLWLAASMDGRPEGEGVEEADQLGRLLRLATLGATMILVMAGVIVSVAALNQQRRQPADQFRLAVVAAERQATDGEVVVASGYCYLEAMVSERVPDRHLRIEAFPADQASHPGWRSSVAAAELGRELRMRSPGWGNHWLWVGEIGSEEAALLPTAGHVQPLFSTGGVGVARVSR